MNFSKIKGLESGLVNIGASEIALRLFLLNELEVFHHRYPHVKLRISNPFHTTGSSGTGKRSGRLCSSYHTCRSEKTTSENSPLFFPRDPYRWRGICGNSFQQTLSSGSAGYPSDRDCSRKQYKRIIYTVFYAP